MYSLYAARCVRCAARWANPWRGSIGASQPLALLTRRRSASAACATVGQTVAPLDDSPLGALFMLRGGPTLGAAQSACARLGAACSAPLSWGDSSFMPVTRCYLQTTSLSRLSRGVILGRLLLRARHALLDYLGDAWRRSIRSAALFSLCRWTPHPPTRRRRKNPELF
jgi:hypothetical protein